VRVSDGTRSRDGTGGLVDTERLGRWLDGLGLEPGAPITAEPIAGGASNAMFRIRRGDARWVLRRPRAVAVDRANDGMRREHRFLRALAGTNVPHPAVVALCDDHEVLGCTFFLMEEVHGVHPDAMSEGRPDGEAAQIAFAMVDALGALHDVDWRAAGLGDLGHPEDFHERQVARWTRQLASYEGRTLADVDDVGAWLDANRPAAFEPVIMHGDYHARNTLMAPDLPARIVAIFDWETATIGDPLLDLGGFCEYVLAHGARNWPSTDMLVERYRTARSFSVVPDLRYHAVLYNFRLGVLLEGVYQRSLRDPTRPNQDAIGDVVARTMARAASLTQGASLSSNRARTS
jgi:aminoglycoside phosphotransferase (APT) family kinase protein